MTSHQPLVHGEQIRSMINCIKDLRRHGIDSVVPLPKICVVGDQSAGKSSLIEALSGIRLPRAAGTCTRCPIEINLSAPKHEQEVWQCNLYLMNSHKFEVEKLGESQILARQNLMGPWTPQNLEEIHVTTILDRKNVLGSVARAQLAILNPTRHFSHFFATTASEDVDNPPQEQMVKFSPNTIRLDISGPGYINLSFIDLPGIIANPEQKHEQFLVQVVKNLVTEHIKSQGSIVLLTLPMSNDVDNSNACSLIRQHDAEPHTLGVLTKPDKVQGPLSEWQAKLLDQSSLRLGHGFHVVKMDEDPALSHCVTRESDFFDQEGWQSVKSQCPEKLGTKSLASTLSSLLERKICDMMPSISEKISAKAADIDEMLKGLPSAPMGDQLTTILGQLILKFGYRAESLFTGSGKDIAADQLNSRWISLADAFKSAVLCSVPDLQVDAAVEQNLRRKPPVTTTPKKASPMTEKAPKPVVKTPKAVKKEVNCSVDLTDEKDEPFTKYKTSQRTFYLKEISRINRKYDTTHVPNQIVPRAVEELNKVSVSHWRQLADEMLACTGTMIREFVLELASDIFQEYRSAPIFEGVKHVINRFLNAVLKDQRDKVHETCEMEQSHPYISDAARLTIEKEEALEVFRSRRNAQRVKEAAERAEAQNQTDNAVRRGPKLQKGEDPLSKPDPFTMQVEIMAVSGIFSN